MKIVLALACTLFVASNMVGASSNSIHLGVVNPDEEESEDTNPVDEDEAKFIEYLVEKCPDAVHAFSGCYNGDHVAMMGCANCFWSNWIADGELGEPSCDNDELDAKVEASVAACTGSCNADCGDVEADLQSCAVSTLCEDEASVFETS